MDQETVTDLKQFITTTISQQLSQHTMEIKQEFKQEFRKIHDKIDDLSESVAQAIEDINHASDQQFKDHERRITRLEQKSL